MQPFLVFIMACANKNCSITGTDRMVSCWLCLSYYHLKCCGLKARDADALADSTKNLQWSCPNCKPIGIEFYNMFKSSKDEFEKINKEFLSLQTKFAQFGELFTKYPNLENFVVSPKRNKTNLSPVASQNLSVASNSLECFSFSSNLQTPITANSVVRSVTPSKENASSLLENRSSDAENVNINGIEPSPSHQNMPSNEISTGSSISPSLNPKPLRAIPLKKNKSVFVSRLASDTTVEDVVFYIKNKLSTNSFVSAYKYTYSQPRSITSFKITVGDELYNYLIDPNFWPVHTFVREYVYNQNQRNVARLPSIVLNNQKN